jgi:surface protein
MSTRYGQKVGPLSTKKVASSFVSYNRNDLPYTGTAALFRPTPPPYVRPEDYLTMPTIANTEQKVALLVFISNDNSNFLSLTVAGNYTVDWGDGVVEDISTGTQANHVYDYSTYDPTNSTLTSLGFKQAIVIITPQSGQNLTSLNLAVRHPSMVAAASTYSQPIEEIYISGPNLGTLTTTSANVFCKKASYVNLINSGTVTSFLSLFAGFAGLQKIDIGKTAAVSSTASMFNNCYTLKEITFSANTNFSSNANASSMFGNCYSLISVPLFDTRSVTTMATMFTNCYTLTSVPLFDTRSVTTMAGMFNACYALLTVPAFDTRSVITMSTMFSSCQALINVPAFDTRSATTMASMFQTCYSLTTVPLFNTINVNTMASMFQDCRSLISVPLFNTINVISMLSMFAGCFALTTVPLFDTRNVTSMQNTFFNCFALETVPLFNTIKVTTFSTTFQGCISLVYTPPFNTPALTVMGSMFQGCFSLKTVSLFNTSLVPNFGIIFQNCYNLTSVPEFNTANATTMSTMFQNCYSLKTVPAFNTGNVTIMDTMFSGCRSLVSVPLFNTVKVTTFANMFVDCSSLTSIPAFDFTAALTLTAMVNGCQSLTNVPNINANAATVLTNTFAGCVSLASVLMTNIKYSVSFASCKLSKEALETIFANLGTAAVGATRTITISNNWGAPTPVSLTGTPTDGSLIISMANTTGLVTGMQVTGTLQTGRAVTFTDSGDLVTLNNHGLSDGDEVAFSVITTTTGIVINRIYFVVGATTNTFQVASSIGGAALPLTTNGSGTVRYNSTIVSIVPNTSVTMSRPMAGGGSQTLVFRLLGTYKAILKGFAVTG